MKRSILDSVNLLPYFTMESVKQLWGNPYTISSAMQALKNKIQAIRPADLAVDLLPLFEQRTFITAWLGGFHEQFDELVKNYI